MDPIPTHLLADVVAETLEQFAFLFGEPGEGATLPADPGEYIEAVIRFHGGGEDGTLRIAAPSVLCREMAGNILGLDDLEVQPDVAMDAIKELANVLVGSLTAQRLGMDVSCALDTPSAGIISAERLNALANNPKVLRVQVDDHLFLAMLDESPTGL